MDFVKLLKKIILIFNKNVKQKHDKIKLKLINV